MNRIIGLVIFRKYNKFTILLFIKVPGSPRNFFTLVVNYFVPNLQNQGDLESHVLNTIMHLKSALQSARRTNDHKLKLSKMYFDRNSAAINTYCVGQRVFLKNFHAQKLDLRHPKEFVTTQKLHQFEYEIRNITDH